jgi:NAD+ kinase
MKVGIVTNKKKDLTLSYTVKVRDFLTQQGHSVIVSDNANELFADANFWVVLGGDGTMLRCSHAAAKHNIPLFGINLGTLGFLTGAEERDGLNVLAKVLAGEYETEKRMMLEAENYIALNDVLIGTSGGLKVFDLYVNNHLLDTIRADGVIVATPTGSTAYSLSAGGPILMPGSQMMVVTPVCPHSLSTRPLVIGADDIVRIVAHQASPVIIDGETVGKVLQFDGITVKKSSFSATIIKTAPVHFYDILRRKKMM